METNKSTKRQYKKAIDRPSAGRFLIEKCEEEGECKNPPGCAILKEIADNQNRIIIIVNGDPVAEPGKIGKQRKARNIYSPRNPEGENLPYPKIDGKDVSYIYVAPSLKEKFREKEGGKERKVEFWEVLWHEMIHAHRHIAGKRRDMDLAAEELDTISAMNDLYAWYRKCSSDENRESVTDRDLNDHPYIQDGPPK